MALRLDDLVQLVGGLEATEIERWVDSGWVRPERAEGGYLFHQVDVARVRLIAEMRQDCAVDDETLPLVLHLLDQVYTLRRSLREVLDAIGEQPEEVRAAIGAVLKRQV
jgi:chaperone modulatory protein CbpM